MREPLLPTSRPPVRLAGDRVVLERAGPGHLDGLQAAIEVSHDELRAFMDWAGDAPQARSVTRGHLEEWVALWERYEEFCFAMSDPVSGEVIGNCALMARRGPGRLEVGYWVRSDRTGTGVATEAAGLLTTVGLALDGIEVVEIRHDAANAASGRVAEKLGYAEIDRREVEIDNPGEVGVEVIWELSRAGRP